MTNFPVIKLDRGLHVMHLFYRVDREVGACPAPCRARLEKLCAAHARRRIPRLATYATLATRPIWPSFCSRPNWASSPRCTATWRPVFLRERCARVFSYLSVTELSEYMPTEEDHHRALVEEEKLQPGSAAYEKRLGELLARMKQYEQYRLYPEMPDWEVMGFYPMSKRRSAPGQLVRAGFPARRRLMAGHARVGRKYAGRVSQLITGSTGLDDWEWGVTLHGPSTGRPQGNRL